MKKLCSSKRANKINTKNCILKYNFFNANMQLISIKIYYFLRNNKLFNSYHNVSKQGLKMSDQKVSLYVEIKYFQYNLICNFFT